MAAVLDADEVSKSPTVKIALGFYQWALIGEAVRSGADEELMERVYDNTSYSGSRLPALDRMSESALVGSMRKVKKAYQSAELPIVQEALAFYQDALIKETSRFGYSRSNLDDLFGVG